MKEDRKTIYDLDDIANRMEFAIALVETIAEAMDSGRAKGYTSSVFAASNYLSLLGDELRDCVNDLFVAKKTKSQEDGKEGEND